MTIALNDDESLKVKILRAIGEPAPIAATPVVGKLDAATVEHYRAERVVTATSASTPPDVPVDMVRERRALRRALRAAIANAELD